ncbi:SAV_915 family protein [Streptomyces pilosus]|uniref:SAV_915 family protein n=1 Tax=Streptomyces pilosus TaxID=28893 RepID=UPI00359BE0ED
MADRRSGELTPGGHAPTDLLYVPVRPERRCYVTCFFRTPSGRRTAVAFTSCARLLAALGQDHPWIRLSVTALRALTAPLGCPTITVDPQVSVRPGSTPLRTRPGPGTSLLPGARVNR